MISFFFCRVKLLLNPTKIKLIDYDIFVRASIIQLTFVFVINFKVRVRLPSSEVELKKERYILSFI